MGRALLSRCAVGAVQFAGSLKVLVRKPTFLFLTVFGNAMVLLGAGLLFSLERGINPAVQSPLDALWWAVATVTTVGYGDVSPVTSAGRVVGLFMMLIGTTLFWSFTALFATVLLTPLSAQVSALQREVKEEEAHIDREIELLQSVLDRLREMQTPQGQRVKRK